MTDQQYNSLREAICDTAYAISLNPNEEDNRRDIAFLAMILTKAFENDTDDNNN